MGGKECSLPPPHEFLFPASIFMGEISLSKDIVSANSASL